MPIKFISLGHRCHLGQILAFNKLRNESFPFDSIIYSYEGVIDCFENNFNNFFPKTIHCEKIFVGKEHPEADVDGNRLLFRCKHGAFTHHDLNNDEIINTFKRRISRLISYLSETDDEVIFLRTVMEDGEIDLLDRFINVIKSVFPVLNFRMFLIYDNKFLPNTIVKYNEHSFIVNSCMETKDENDKTDPIRYKFLFDYLKNVTTFCEFNGLDMYNENIVFKNDYYKGYAILNGILPYDNNN